MSKLTLTIEDLPNGKVKAILDPPAEMIFDKINAGYDATSAEGYALLCVRAIREESKRLDPTKILIPRTGRA